MVVINQFLKQPDRLRIYRLEVTIGSTKVLTDTIKTDNHVAVGGVGSYFGITKLSSLQTLE